MYTMTQREFHTRQLAGMEAERAMFIPHWRDINDYIMPRTSRFFAQTPNKGNLRNTKINDATATLALRALSAGMVSGITNPARPWVQMRVADPDLNKRHSTRQYLDLVRDAMQEIFLRSNIYTALPATFSNLGGYGTDAFILEEDDEAVIRAYSWPIGSYMLSTNARGVVDTGYRKFQMTASQLIRRFGIDNVTQPVRKAYERGSYNEWFMVIHALEPNPDFNPGGLSSRNMPLRSVYYEEASRPDEWLRRGGYKTNPLIASRWAVLGEDTYGTSPGMEALGDVMALQLEQRRKIMVVDKHVNPPTQAPVSLEKRGVSNLPGGVTYVDVMQNGQPITPTYQTQLSGMQYLLQDIQEVQGRINSCFFKDLFLLIANDERSNITATEIAARQEEKLLALGPVYLRANDELLDPMVSRTFEIMVDRSRPYWEGKLNGAPIIPPPPPELAGADVSFEFISTMSQAMKSVGITSIERTLTFAGNLAQAFPDILDNLSGDRAIRTYANVNGTPADLLTDEKEVEKVRAARAQQAAAQQQMMAAQQMAGTAKDLAQAPLSDNNALSQLLGRMNEAQGVQP
jgi:hypothetical protein